jgi:hypothetical protein
VPVHHRARKGGKSKYGVRQFLWRPLLDLLGVWWFSRRRCPLAKLESLKGKTAFSGTNGVRPEVGPDLRAGRSKEADP